MWFGVVSFGLVVVGVLAGVAPGWAGEPFLRRVTLSAGGVGQFEFSADVEGGATLSLGVPLEQVDDLLKSLRVDDARGAPSVRLPGRAPLGEAFRALPFGPDAFGSVAGLLGRLVGEAVRVPGADVSGSILSVEAFDAALPNGGGTVTRHRLAVATAGGVATVVLEDAGAVEFVSEGLRWAVATGLSAIAAQRVQDRRTLQVVLADGGARRVGLGYVVPAPVWKASYRLTVPAEGGGPARLQGFAVVENLSGRDWRDVEVVLTSGQPVLFHSPLYEAVFTTRPEAPVEVANRLVPALDQGALAEVERPRPTPAPAALMQAGAPMQAAAPTRAGAPVGPGAQPEVSQVRQSLAQVEFRLAAPVTASAGESLMLPIISRDIPVRRVALYQPETDAVHPLVALSITNDTGGAIPPGLATMFEARAGGAAGFIGDARLPGMQPGEERLASFAADLAVRVETTQSGDVTVTGGSVAGGVLTVVRRERSVTRYRVAMPAGSGRTVMIEHPRRAGWTLAEPAGAEPGGAATTESGGAATTEVRGAATMTPTGYRVVREMAAGAVEVVTVALERPLSERVVLTDAGAPALGALAVQGQLSPALRAALGRAGVLKAELERRVAAVKELVARRAEVVADQGRVRSNLGAVPGGSELQRRYLGQLQAQETELSGLGAQIDAGRRGVAEAEGALRGFVAGLAL